MAAVSEYADLEKKHGLEDVMPVDQYRHKAHLMEGAFQQLVKHRRQVQGRDLAPHYDTVRLWPVVVVAYSLLEQCIKLLVGVRTEGYLNGGGAGTAKDDGHNLPKAFGRLTELDRGLLEECYAEYASFIQFPPEFQKLEQYLQEVSKKGGQIAWRYFLLEKSPKNMKELPGPLSPDMFLEITRSAIDILMAKAWTDHGMHGVHRRLKHQLCDALSRQLPLESVSIEDSYAWVQRGGGLINAFSRHIRAGALDGECGDALAKWLDEAVEQLRQSAERQYDVDMRRFLHMASRCCMTTDGKRFEFRNHRPEPLSKSLEPWRGSWSISWRTEESSWSGPIDDPPSQRLDDWGLPLRTGQTFKASWRTTENAPAMQELVFGAHGELKVLRHGQVLANMRALVHPHRPSGRFPHPDQPLEPTDRGDKLDHARFIRTGDCRSADGTGSEPECHYPALVEDYEDYACPDCAGKGFCRNCLGEAANADDCHACADALGLCPACRGHGRDGHHAILAATDA